MLEVNAQVTGNFIDERDGKKYSTITIGNQIWMSENLAFKTAKGSWSYNNDEMNTPIYGYLYNWKTACTSCPSGWRLPSKEDYEIMILSLNIPDSLSYKNLIEGGNSGFNAKFSGWYAGRKFGQLNEHTDFWTATSDESTLKGVYRFSLYKKENLVYMNVDFPNYGFSVRCIKLRRFTNEP